MISQVKSQHLSILLAGAAILLGICSGQAQTYTESTLYPLIDTDGAAPTNLIEGADGNFYGIATFGGLSVASTPPACNQSPNGEGCGTIFKITSSGNYSVLYTFLGGTDGAYPIALLQGGDGNLYGVAALGGNIPTGSQCGPPGTYCFGFGTIFELSTAGDFNVLYAFGTTATDGAYPVSLIQASDGNFYGTTYSNTVFRLSPEGTLTTLATFGGANGEYPTGIVQASDGNLYGTTQADGSGTACNGWGCGTIYEMSLSGIFSTIYTFSGEQDGAAERNKPGKEIVIKEPGHDRGACPPYCIPSRSEALFTNAMTQGSDGSLYGTTPIVGITLDPQDDKITIPATIFKLSPSGNLSTPYTFTGATDGGGSFQGLFLAGDGNFYGTSGNTVFQLTPSESFNTIYTDSSSIGYSFGAVLQGNDGLLYSEEPIGGSATACLGEGCGTIFTLSPSPAIPPPVQLKLSSMTFPLGSPLTLTWTVANAFSLSMQQCYAFVQNGATTAGTWSGLQSGSVANGAFTGSAALTPTHVGTYTYALTCGGVESGFATLIVPNPSITTSPTLPNGQVSGSYSQTLAAADGTPPYTWTVTAGSLPPGLSLSSAGVISGTPTQSGNYSFTIQALDSEVPAVTAAATFTLNVPTPDFSLGVKPIALSIAQGQQGTATFTATSTGGYALPVTFSCSGLPAEASCSFSPASVTPTASGATSTLTITTTAPSGMVRKATSRGKTRRFAGTTALALLFAWFTGLRRKRLTRGLLVSLLGSVALLSSMAGCGGGTPSPTGNTGTPTGPNQVTVTAGSTGTGATQHTVSFSVTITN
jgi:uncharacterized repeat protein (TIGR03803 family)